MPFRMVATPTGKSRERVMVWGDAGAGKSTLVLDWARHMPDTKFWVNDTDVSFAYYRLLETEFQDVEANGNVEVRQSCDWDEFVTNTADMMKEAGNNRQQENQVLVYDNGTFPWQWVQDQHVTAQYGVDYDEFLGKLRREYKDDNKGYAKALSEGMQWAIINKKFHKGFYEPMMRWRGHAAIICMAADLKQEKDTKVIAEFGTVGSKPRGNKDLPYVMHTNMLLQAKGKRGWVFSTTKDRGVPKQERQPMTSFTEDYLVGLRGWNMERQRYTA